MRCCDMQHHAICIANANSLRTALQVQGMHFKRHTLGSLFPADSARSFLPTSGREAPLPLPPLPPPTVASWTALTTMFLVSHQLQDASSAWSAPSACRGQDAKQRE